MKRINIKNTRKGKVPNTPGLYTLYNKNRKPIYKGHSRRLRHRLQSYYQKDCFKAHPTKRRLRGKAKYFSYKSMPIKKARSIDRNKKFRFNTH